MELFAKRMTWELDNDEGLSCLFFELEDGYFTLSRKTGAEALRLEMNDPANGQLIDPDCFEYAVDNTRFRLNIVRNNRKVLRYLEEHHINTEVPGAYGFLGGQAPYGASNLHNPQFDFDDRVLSTGAALWVTIARRRLAES